jgi:hypothetical protein
MIIRTVVSTLDLADALLSRTQSTKSERRITRCIMVKRTFFGRMCFMFFVLCFQSCSVLQNLDDRYEPKIQGSSVSWVLFDVTVKKSGGSFRVLAGTAYNLGMMRPHDDEAEAGQWESN